MAKFRILIADDDAALIEPFVAGAITEPGLIDITSCTTPSAALEWIAKAHFDVLFLDIDFGAGLPNGLSVIPQVRSLRPDLRIVMLSGRDDEATLLKALALSANDFISKRLENLATIPTYIENLLQQVRAHTQELSDGREIAARVGASFTSQAMAQVFRLVMTARNSPHLPVLITGETGVGKELIARAINIDLKRPRVDVDCGAIPDNLIESEFFGHVKGAFTGADSNKDGKFVKAHGGDLFLDEIGNLRRAAQDRFLRAIQTKEIIPVGSSTSRRVDVRIIAATNENLDAMVAAGNFRSDLLERLKGVWIEIPALRKRPEDIEPIIKSIIAGSQRPDIKMSPTCLAVMKAYQWPGNVRELESTILAMIANASGDQLNIMHLPERIKSRLAQSVTTSSTPSQHPRLELPADGTWDEIVDSIMLRYLPERFRNLGADASRSELARSLGMARNTLSSHLKRLNIRLEGDTEV